MDDAMDAIAGEERGNHFINEIRTCDPTTAQGNALGPLTRFSEEG